MDILLLGGTRFLGRHLVAAALERGHHVTTFTRGQATTELPAGVEQLHGDRDGDLRALEGRHWDTVIDTGGYVPRIVRASAELLTQAVERYIFISSCSVYADFSQPCIDESAPVIQLSDEQSEDFTTPEGYGGLKALCEKVVEQLFPQRTLVIRPGLIVGPYDPTDRFTYWPHRIAQGGEILAPREPELLIQYIDARDLASWIIRLSEAKTTGIFNAKGPAGVMTLGELLTDCQGISGERDAHVTWVSEEFLQAHQVEEYSELPLWVPREMAGFSSFKSEKAIAQGLTYRPQTETIADTLAWDRTRPADYELRSGLKPEREQALLQEWHTLHSQD